MPSIPLHDSPDTAAWVTEILEKVRLHTEESRNNNIPHPLMEDLDEHARNVALQRMRAMEEQKLAQERALAEGEKRRKAEEKEELSKIPGFGVF